MEQEQQQLHPIATWVITNNHSLNVYEIQHGINETMLVGYNTADTHWVTIQYEPDEDEAKAFIEFEDQTYYLDECMRLGV